MPRNSLTWQMKRRIRYLTDATVLEISEDKVITAATPDGLKTVAGQRQ